MENQGYSNRTVMNKKTFHRSPLLSMAFIGLSILIESIRSQVTFALIARELFSTTTSSDTRFWSGSISSAVGQNVLSSNNQLVQCYAGVSRPTDGNQLRCFGYDSTLFATFDINSMGLTYGLAFKKNGRIIVAGATSKLAEYQITSSAGTYAITQITDLGSYPSGSYPSGAVDRPNTVYTYLGPYFSSGSTGNNQYFYRWESGTNTLTRSSTNIAAVTSVTSGVAADTYTVQIWRETTLISAGAYAALVFASMSTLDLVVADTSAGATNTAYGIVLDNINDIYLYHPIKETPFTFRKLDISGSSPSVAMSLNLDRPITGLVNCGTLNYIFAIRISSNVMKLYNKVNLADVSATAIRFKTAPRPSAVLEPFFLSPNTFKVSSAASITSTQSSYQSSMVYFDYCGTRDATSFICSACKSGYFKNDTNAWNECLMPSQFASGYGSDIPNNLIVKCKTGCLNCLGDVNICSSCDQSNGYLYLFKSNTDVSCTLKSNIPLGYGINVAFNLSQVLPCTQSGCIDCSSNKDKCLQCFSFYQLKAGRCDLKSFGLVSKSADALSKTLIIQLEKQINTNLLTVLDYKLDLMQGLEASADQQDIMITSMVLLDTKDGYKITYSPKPSDRGGEYTGLRFSRKTTTQGGVLFMSAANDAAFTSPEIYFDTVVLAPVEFSSVQTTGSVMAQVFNWILKITNFAFRIGLMPIELFVAPIIERQVAYFSFLRNIDGDFIFKPSYIIYWMSSRNFFGFDISNPHVDWAKTGDCKAPETMNMAGVRCDLFTNYGHNLNILAAGLILTLIVWGTCKIIAPNLTSPRATHILDILKEAFGLRYAASWFDSVSLDLIGLCILNLPYINQSNTGITIGFIVSVVILAGYALYYAGMAYQISKHIKSKSTQQASLFQAKSQDQETIPQRSELLTFPLEEYKADFEFKIFYYTPVILAAKNVALQVIAISLQGSGWGQILPILTIEFAMMMYIAISLPKQSLIDNLYDILIHIINGAYMAVKIGSTQVSYDRRQGSFGSGLLIVVFGLLYTTTIYVGWKIALGIKNFIKKVRHIKQLSSLHTPLPSDPEKPQPNQIKPLVQVKVNGGPSTEQPSHQPQPALNSSKLQMAS
jgi:hypothetical protein